MILFPNRPKKIKKFGVLESQIWEKKKKIIEK
jgi:hypothetical protein